MNRTITVVSERDGQASPRTLDVASPPLALLGPGDVVGLDPGADRPSRPPTRRPQLRAQLPRRDRVRAPRHPVAVQPRRRGGRRRRDAVADARRRRRRTRARAGAAHRAPGRAEPGAGGRRQQRPPEPGRRVGVGPRAGASRDRRRRGGRCSPTPAPGWADVRSRLVAPTHIEPEHAYLACVVPVYAAGREAGLEPTSPPGLGTSLAWDGSGSVSLAGVRALALPRRARGRLRDPRAASSARSTTSRPRAAPRRGRTGRLAAASPRRRSRRRRALPGRGARGAHRDRQGRHVVAARTRPRRRRPGGPAAPAQGARRPHRGEATADEPLVGPPLYGQWHAQVDSIDGHPESASWWRRPTRRAALDRAAQRRSVQPDGGGRRDARRPERPGTADGGGVGPARRGARREPSHPVGRSCSPRPPSACTSASRN